MDYISIAVLVVAVVSVGAYFFLRTRQKPSDPIDGAKEPQGPLPGSRR